MGRRGNEHTMNLVIGTVVLLFVAMIVMYLLYTKTGIFSKKLDECTAFCSDNCLDDGAGALNPFGTDWCRAGIWDVTQKGDNDDAGMYYADKAGDNPEAVKGEALGLKCCYLIPRKTAPPSFLDTSRRTDDPDAPGGSNSGRRDVISMPKIVAYVNDNPTPIGNGQTIEVYANMDYKIKMRVSNLDDGVHPNGAKEKYPKKCVAILYDVNTNEEISRYTCPAEFFKKAVEIDTLKFSGVEEGIELMMAIVISEEPGAYNPSITGDVKSQFTLRVSNPLKIADFPAGWAKEKTITFSCSDISCTNAKYDFVTPEQCKKGASITKTANATGDNTWTVTIKNDSQTKGKYFCAKATQVLPQGATGTAGEYYAGSPTPLNIDTTRPRVTANYMVMEMVTRVLCDDIGGSGCKGMYGYYYISDPTSFIGALATGLKKPYVWCPGSRNAYRWGTEAEVPYNSRDDFKVLCIMAEDSAGNAGIDIVLAYNGPQVLAKIIAGLMD